MPHEVNYIEHVFAIGVLGGISMIKGFNIIKEMDEIITKDNLKIKIVIIGEVVGDIKSKNVSVLGKYGRDEISELTIKNEVDIFLVPSICPETFSYTTEEIIKTGFPIAVFNLGAQAERVFQYKKGLIISEINAEKAIKEIMAFSRSLK